MKKRLSLFVICFLLVVSGIVSFTIPLINNYIFYREQNSVITEFENTILDDSFSESKKSTDTKIKLKNQDKKAAIDLTRLRKDVKSYNKQVYYNQLNNKSAADYEKTAIKLSDYGFNNDIYGYIEIPKINVRMGLLLGASSDNMTRGAVHLNDTSIPYGGKNTNAVIAGHCGYWGMDMFRYISNLEVGDRIIITTPFEKLNYKVSKTTIVEPNDTESLKIEQGKDKVTLLTCYPYPTNKQRFVVICSRVFS